MLSTRRKYKPNYEKFGGEELKVADEIQRLRLDIIVSSYAYYRMSDELVPNRTWDEWARRLAKLQQEHPAISAEVEWFADAFKDWEGVSGEFLPLNDPWVIEKTHRLLQRGEAKKPTVSKVTKRKLF